MFRRFVKTVCIATVGAIGGWKLRERYEEMVGPVRPASILARAAKLWDSISFPSANSSSGSGGEGAALRELKELEEKFRREQEKAARREEKQERNTQMLLAAIEGLKQADPRYQHEFPALPPPAARRP